MLSKINLSLNILLNIFNILFNEKYFKNTSGCLNGRSLII